MKMIIGFKSGKELELKVPDTSDINKELSKMIENDFTMVYDIVENKIKQGNLIRIADVSYIRLGE